MSKILLRLDRVTELVSQQQDGLITSGECMAGVSSAIGAIGAVGLVKGIELHSTPRAVRYIMAMCHLREW